MTNYQNIKQEKNNNLRQIEINEYYSLRNSAILDIFKTILVALIPIIIVIIIGKSNLIPESLVTTILIILIFAIIVIVFMKIMDINSRDPRNYSNFKIPFDSEAIALEHSGKLNSVSDELEKEFHGTFGCFDDSCCDTGMKFDNFRKKCVLSSSKLNTNSNTISIGGENTISSINLQDNPSKLLNNDYVNLLKEYTTTLEN